MEKEKLNLLADMSQDILTTNAYVNHILSKAAKEIVPKLLSQSFKL